MERDERKGLRPLEILNRYKYVLLVAALGSVLLAWPGGGDRKSGGQMPVPTDREETAAELETELEKILGKIQGVGRVDVLLTLHSGRELILAEDTDLRYSGNVQAPDDYERSSKPVVTSGGGEENVVVTRQKYPQYRGALVVCDGGGNDAVRLQVVEAVAALTGLGSDRIAVVKWQAGDHEERNVN